MCARAAQCYVCLGGEGNFENTHNEVIFEDDNILKDCVKCAFSLPVVLSFVPNSNLRNMQFKMINAQYCKSAGSYRTISSDTVYSVQLNMLCYMWIILW